MLAFFVLFRRTPLFFLLPLIFCLHDIFITHYFRLSNNVPFYRFSHCLLIVLLGKAPVLIEHDSAVSERFLRRVSNFMDIES